MAPPTMTRSLPALLVLLVLSACGGSEGTEPGTPTVPEPPQPTEVPLALSTGSGAPLKAVFVGFPSPRPSGQAEIEATLGDEPVTVALQDDTTGVFMIPSVSAGSRRLEVPLGTDEVGVATLSVLTPPVIEDPRGAADGKVSQIETALDSLVGQIRAGLLEELGAGESQAAAIDTWIEGLRTELAGTSPEDVEELALFLETNAELFELLPPPTAAGSAAAVTGMEERLDAFLREVTARKISLVATVGACSAAVVLSGPAAAVAVGVCGGFLLDQVQGLMRSTKSFLDDNVFVPVSLQLASVVGGSPSAAPPSGEGSAAAQAGVEIAPSRPVELRFASEYRTLRKGDRSQAGEVFELLDDVRELWGWVLDLLPDDAGFDSYHLEDVEGTRTEIVQLGEGSSVTLVDVSGEGVSCSSASVAGGARVECSNGTLSDQSATLTFHHTNAFGEATTTVSATVVRNQPAGAVAESGSGQGRGPDAEFAETLVARFTDTAGDPLASYPVSWSVVSGSGEILESDGTTDEEGRVQARVQAGSRPGVLGVEAVARDRWGGEHVGRFDLVVEEPWARLSLGVAEVSDSWITDGTWDGFPTKQLHCRVTVEVLLEGNTSVTWVSDGFQHHMGGKGFDVYTFPRSGTTEAPASGIWFEGLDFWFNFMLDEEIQPFRTEFWVEYMVGGQEQRAETSWTCSP